MSAWFTFIFTTVSFIIVETLQNIPVWFAFAIAAKALISGRLPAWRMAQQPAMLTTGNIALQTGTPAPTDTPRASVSQGVYWVLWCAVILLAGAIGSAIIIEVTEPLITNQFGDSLDIIFWNSVYFFGGMVVALPYVVFSQRLPRWAFHGLDGVLALVVGGAISMGQGATLDLIDITNWVHGGALFIATLVFFGLLRYSIHHDWGRRFIYWAFVNTLICSAIIVVFDYGYRLLAVMP